MILQANRNFLERESHGQLCSFLAKGKGDALSKGNAVGVLACAKQVVQWERLAYVRGGRGRARKRVAMGNRGFEPASLMAWSLFKAPEVACYM